MCVSAAALLQSAYQRLSLLDDITADGPGCDLVEGDDRVAPLETAVLQQLFPSLLRVNHHVVELGGRGGEGGEKWCVGRS